MFVSGHDSLLLPPGAFVDNLLADGATKLITVQVKRISGLVATTSVDQVVQGSHNLTTSLAHTGQLPLHKIAKLLVLNLTHKSNAIASSSLLSFTFTSE